MKFSIDWGTKVKEYSEKFLWRWLQDKNIFWFLLSIILLLSLHSCITMFWSTMDYIYNKWSHKIMLELKIPVAGWHQSHSSDTGNTLLICVWWCWYKYMAPPVVQKHSTYNYVYFILLDSNNKWLCSCFMYLLYYYYFRVCCIFILINVCCKTVCYIMLAATSYLYILCLLLLLIVWLSLMLDLISWFFLHSQKLKELVG